MEGGEGSVAVQLGDVIIQVADNPDAEFERNEKATYCLIVKVERLRRGKTVTPAPHCGLLRARGIREEDQG